MARKNVSEMTYFVSSAAYITLLQPCAKCNISNIHCSRLGHVVLNTCIPMRLYTLGLPDLPYFTGDPVFQPRSPASRKEAARETESPVFDYRPLASTPPGMPGTHPHNILVGGDVNGNIPPILLRTFGYSRPLLVALRSLSLKPI